MQAKDSRRQFFTWIVWCLGSFVSIPGIKEFAGMDVGFSNCWSVGIETASFTPSVPEATRIPTMYRSSIKYSLACVCEKLKSLGLLKTRKIVRKNQ